MGTDLSQHEADRGEPEERQGIAGEIFEILGQPSAAVEPCEGALDDPTPRQDLEAFGAVRPFDDFRREMRQGLFLSRAELRSLIAAIGEEFAQERMETEQGPENQNTAVAILNVAGMDHRMKQQAYRIDKDMALFALDLLARIIAVRVDAAPPFSAPFTLWLSMTQAAGLASRPIFSRHLT